MAGTGQKKKMMMKGKKRMRSKREREKLVETDRVWQEIMVFTKEYTEFI